MPATTEKPATTPNRSESKAKTNLPPEVLEAARQEGYERAMQEVEAQRENTDDGADAYERGYNQALEDRGIVGNAMDEVAATFRRNPMEPDPHFDPLRVMGKVGNKDYLQASWRLVWLRACDPGATVVTELVTLVTVGDEDRGIPWQRGNVTVFLGHAVFKCTITLTNGAVGTGYGSCNSEDFKEYIEKAETKATGRALEKLGFGTTSALTEPDGGPDNMGGLADTPVQGQRNTRSDHVGSTQSNGTGSTQGRTQTAPAAPSEAKGHTGTQTEKPSGKSILTLPEVPESRSYSKLEMPNLRNLLKLGSPMDQQKDIWSGIINTALNLPEEPAVRAAFKRLTLVALDCANLNQAQAWRFEWLASRAPLVVIVEGVLNLAKQGGFLTESLEAAGGIRKDEIVKERADTDTLRLPVATMQPEPVAAGDDFDPLDPDNY